MLNQDIQFVKGVGPYIGKKLNKLGIFTVEDLLYFFPRSYDDRRQLPKINQLKSGQTVTLFVSLISFEERKINPKLSLLKGKVSDATGKLYVVWFNQPFLKKQLSAGQLMVLKGKVDVDTYAQALQLKVSETEFIKSHEEIKEFIGRVLPIYGLTHGLTQVQLRRMALSIIKQARLSIRDPLPQHLKSSLNLESLQESIYQLHHPEDPEMFTRSRTRIIFDDFFYYQLQLAKKYDGHKNTLKTTPLMGSSTFVQKYLDSLPYSLTSAQENVLEEISKDLSKTTPMNRLLQGDVGAGKTDVAVVSLLIAIESGKTGALMAPTEILAVQHSIKLRESLSPLGVDVFLLKGKQKASEKKKVLERLSSGDPLIVVGTHALIEDSVDIPNLGLVVIDEQHRFGVLQRQKLQQKASSPHCLFMTATPIPRSFMLTSFGDLDKSIIGELPPGRIPPKTHFVPESDQVQYRIFLKSQLDEGAQVYVVFPLVEESEKLDLTSAEQGFEEYKSLFPDTSIGLIHGKMKPQEKADVMASFKNNEFQLLIATTVIEVGVDVPNSTVMAIHHAERFGLSQLHQLRGRVGRGRKESHCFLIGDPKSENSKKRIQSMISTTDGFKLAEVDLQIRGPGDMLGTKQAGLPEFKLANLVQDEPILKLARTVAFRVIKDDPQLALPEHKGISDELQKRKTQGIGEVLN